MKQEIFIVYAFADKPFSGNPAAICLLDHACEDKWMQDVAAEMNLGPCRSWRFNRQHEDGYFCALTGETINKGEIDLICREHELPDNRELTA